jgi:hypothetical protein
MMRCSTPHRARGRSLEVCNPSPHPLSEPSYRAWWRRAGSNTRRPTIETRGVEQSRSARAVAEGLLGDMDAV